MVTTGAAGAQHGDLLTARAHWVSRDLIAWNVSVSPQHSYTLHYDPAGAMHVGPSGVEGGHALPLEFAGAKPPPEVLSKFPHLAGYAVFRLGAGAFDLVRDALTGQIAVSITGEDGAPIDATALQIAGVLDDLYTYTDDLGVSYERDIPILRVWAPTARSVALHLFDDADLMLPGRVLAMREDPATGVWSVTGTAAWTGKFYLYEVDVFVRSTGRVETNLVTDPYSVSLSTNSRRSQIVDLAATDLMPPGWHDLHKPELAAPEDIVLYELHVRDFSIFDRTVSEAHRGTFKAFTETASDGMRHLKALAGAGVTHVHLLPVFDIATIEEDRSARVEPDVALLGTYPPDSDRQQAIIAAVRERDGFNWGYDPYHYTVPEGSYATDPDGARRILEFREMVKALSDIGLRVVMDVVYNHTHASGQQSKSVLDKIVPGYYHRLNAHGAVETSTCCQNTATEHAMMERLMVDSLVTWATAYKVEGFRFDLMGHHMVSNMVKARDTLQALTVELDGVDGSKIYLYGEGWNFGEVADGARGLNATQFNMAGTGIGTFSDRLRDAARGGGPFSGLQEQGFINGQWYAPNGTNTHSAEDQRATLLYEADLIRVGLAGNLQDYTFTDLAGKVVSAKEVWYNGQPAGYTRDPQEAITYVEAHDNETLFDAIQLKAPMSATLEQRVRMHNLGTSLVSLAQGIPFFQAGQEMLRSKSLDRNSYDSGDWFNRLDFTYESNNWGAGLPPAENEAHWNVMRPLLANPALKPGRAEILQAVAHVREMLQIRKSSRLFRLRTAEEIQARLAFLNTGPEQIPGLIVMRLSDTEGVDLDGNFDRIVVLFNAILEAQTFTAPSLAGAALGLHPVQAASHDAMVKRSRFDAASGTFTVPAQTTAVFVERAGERV